MRSRSDVMCDENSTPRLSSWMKSSRMSRIPLRATGSRPLVASSRISRRGRCASAAAIESFIFIPREYSEIFFFSGSSNSRRYFPNSAPSQVLNTRLRISPTSPALRPPWKQHSSNTTPICSLARISPRMLSSPKIRTLPPSRRSSFRISRMVVVLPAPFSPTRPMMLPAGSEKLTSSSEKPA